MNLIRAAVVAIGTLVAVAAIPAEAMPIVSVSALDGAKAAEIQQVQYRYGHRYGRPYGYGYRRPFGYRRHLHGYHRRPFGYGYGRRYGYRGGYGYRRPFRYGY